MQFGPRGSAAKSVSRRVWLRGLDSNQDNQLQRLACYQLHYPGVAEKLFTKFSRLARICCRRTELAVAALPGFRQFVTLLEAIPCGEVSERFKEHAWKACVGETQPWVRIPPSPPEIERPFSVRAGRAKVGPSTSLRI